MPSDTPRLRDLVTVLYKPRETMKRILDASRRWTVEVIVLACVCSSMADKDFTNLRVVLPDLSLAASLALAVLTVMLGSVLWVLGVYLFSWMVTFAGRRIGGGGEVADVRAAIAWGLVPLIWSVIYRIPIAIYSRRFDVGRGEGTQALLEFVRQGGCTLAIVMLTFQIGFFLWIVFVTSSCVGEALRLSTWEGLGALAIAAAAPVILGIAAALAFNT